jgi:hypothetical protein
MRQCVQGIALHQHRCCHCLYLLLHLTDQLLLLIAAIHRLLAIHDTVGMASEIARTVAAVYCCSVPQTVLIAVASRGIIPVDTRIHLCSVVCSFYILLDVNVLSRHAWGTHTARKINYRKIAVTASSQAAASTNDRCITLYYYKLEL